LKATNDFNITEYIFTVTRDNASPNNAMLDQFEATAEEQREGKPNNLQQPWSFTRKEGDVRCIGHVINLAVQNALTILKAVPAEKTEVYRMVYQAATLPKEFDKGDIVSALYKLQRHIYIFRKRRAWRVALENQCKAHNTIYRKPTLDMPVCWNSTYNMIKRACDLRVPIQSVCAVQDLDLSVKALELTLHDWQILNQMLKIFAIFVRPSKKLQGEKYAFSK
jgi:hypothetical protein